MVFDGRRLFEWVGSGLRRERLERNWTQEALAERAGVGMRTVQNAERGQGISLSTLVALMKALGVEGRLEGLFPEVVASPVELVKRRGAERQRATGVRGSAGEEVDGGGARIAEDEGTWRWGN